MIRAAALTCAAALCACSAEPEPPANAVKIDVPRPAPKPAAPPPPTVLAPGELPSPELDGAVGTAGAWESSGDVARFGTPGSPATFAMRCDRTAGTIAFLLPGGEGSTIRIIAASGAATYPAGRDGGMLVAQATAEDRFVADALVRAKGRIAVQVDDAAAIALPADPAIDAVVERCWQPR